MQLKTILVTITLLATTATPIVAVSTPDALQHIALLTSPVELVIAKRGHEDHAGKMGMTSDIGKREAVPEPLGKGKFGKDGNGGGSN